VVLLGTNESAVFPVKEPAKACFAFIGLLVAGDAEEGGAVPVEVGPEDVDEALAVEEVVGAGEDGYGEDADNVGGFGDDAAADAELADDGFDEVI